MRASIRSALEQSAELTRQGRLVDGLAVGEAAINQSTDDEQSEIRQWLNNHADDFTGQVS
ncbi:hypothetical protein [Streptomyces malaysiensis]|uniref:Uncharacterized protein n=1 Tax=Streptomyces malaysiensis subsp. samsunensis TaxID=459658 RepID=A0A9X2LVY4_STRMQ|nr:hypothetical protein [Streptomyces samsunensis]MCQ8830529.1 hypothetical protein [Streptomyces samsunensis]